MSTYINTAERFLGEPQLITAGSSIAAQNGDLQPDLRTPASTGIAIPEHESTFMPAMTMDVALARRAAIVEFTRKLMLRDQDFGEIPGSHKPTLLKPGAEKLCNFFGLEPEFTPRVEDIDWTGAQHGGETFCYIRYQCRLFRGRRILGVGEGSCNSRESRYRYRWVPIDQIPASLDPALLLRRGSPRTCSEFEFAIERGETLGVYGKTAEYWSRFREAITAGTARRTERPSRQGPLPAWEIDVDTTLYRIPNPEIADIVNTIQKMAQKRALIAATLIATSASEFFTQDVEDNTAEIQSILQTGKDLPKSGMAPQPEATESSDPPEPESPPVEAFGAAKPWKKFGEMRQFFEQIRQQVGETSYMAELEAAGVHHPGEFRSSAKAFRCYLRLTRIASEREVA
jgi:hypothetical protein